MNLSLIGPKEHRQLFLDGHAIEKMSGVKQTLHPPKKCGPIIRPNRSLEMTGIPATVVVPEVKLHEVLLVEGQINPERSLT